MLLASLEEQSPWERRYKTAARQICEGLESTVLLGWNSHPPPPTHTLVEKCLKQGRARPMLQASIWGGEEN